MDFQIIIQEINSWAHQNPGLLSIIAIFISLISIIIVITDRFCVFFKSIIKWFIWKLRGDFRIEADFFKIYPLNNNNEFYNAIKENKSMNPNFIIKININIDRLTKNENRIKDIKFSYRPIDINIIDCTEIIKGNYIADFNELTKNQMLGDRVWLIRDYILPSASIKLVLVLCSDRNPSGHLIKLFIKDRNNKKYCKNLYIH